MADQAKQHADTVAVCPMCRGTGREVVRPQNIVLPCHACSCNCSHHDADYERAEGR